MPDPAFDTVQRLIMRAGTVNRFREPADVYNALVITGEARAAGHAVMFDETFNSAKEFVEAHVVHYKTCKECQGKSASGGA